MESVTKLGLDEQTVRTHIRAAQYGNALISDNFAELLAVIRMTGAKTVLWVGGDEPARCGIPSYNVNYCLLEALPVGGTLYWTGSDPGNYRRYDVEFQQVHLPLRHKVDLVCYQDGDDPMCHAKLHVIRTRLGAWKYTQREPIGESEDSGTLQEQTLLEGGTDGGAEQESDSNNAAGSTDIGAQLTVLSTGETTSEEQSDGQQGGGEDSGEVQSTGTTSRRTRRR